MAHRLALARALEALEVRLAIPNQRRQSQKPDLAKLGSTLPACSPLMGSRLARCEQRAVTGVHGREIANTPSRRAILTNPHQASSVLPTPPPDSLTNCRGGRTCHSLVSPVLTSSVCLCLLRFSAGHANRSRGRARSLPIRSTKLNMADGMYLSMFQSSTTSGCVLVRPGVVFKPSQPVHHSPGCCLLRYVCSLLTYPVDSVYIVCVCVMFSSGSCG